MHLRRAVAYRRCHSLGLFLCNNKASIQCVMTTMACFFLPLKIVTSMAKAFYLPDFPTSLSGSLVYQKGSEKDLCRILSDLDKAGVPYLFVSHRWTTFILWLNLSLFAEWKLGLKSGFSWVIFLKLFLWGIHWTTANNQCLRPLNLSFLLTC